MVYPLTFLTVSSEKLRHHNLVKLEFMAFMVLDCIGLYRCTYKVFSECNFTVLFGAAREHVDGLAGG